MTKLNQDLSIAQALSLIDSYAFDVGTTRPEELLQSWLSVYHASWIRLATIEALYLGRYKTISIEHILNVWLRLGSPNTHYTREFERLICRKLPKHLIEVHNFADESETTQSAIDEPDLFTLPAESKLSHIYNQKFQSSAQNYTDSSQIKAGKELNSHNDQLKSSGILAQISKGASLESNSGTGHSGTSYEFESQHGRHEHLPVLRFPQNPCPLECRPQMATSRPPLACVVRQDSQEQDEDETKSLDTDGLSRLNSLPDQPQPASQENKQFQQSPSASSLTAKEPGKTSNNRASNNRASNNRASNNRASMSLISALGISYQPDWSELSQEHTPIHKFIPLPDVSSFFNKLKAFAD